GNLWQSLEWKRYQETLGREVRIYVVEDASKGRGCSIVASALVTIDRTVGGLSTLDMPRGPLVGVRYPTSAKAMAGRQVSGVSFTEECLRTITQDAEQDRCIALFLSPSIELKTESWKLKASSRHEQPEATRIIDLTKTEEEILAQMHQKGRYNIKVAQKNGVRVEQSDDVEAFYGLLQETAKRDGFQILPLKAYKAFLERLPGSFLLLAYAPPPLSPLWPPSPCHFPPEGEKGCPSCLKMEYFPSPADGGGDRGGGEPIAGLMGIVWGQTGIYYYGASDYAQRALMAPYLLQWEAMRRCRAKGCTTYDLLGITKPPLPSQTMPLSPVPSPTAVGEGRTRWAGISAFKEKFGGTVVTYPPEQQIILRPVFWRVLQWKRKLLG
ncbi:peptidoglycan bridge formation glycyltransferase FemA/FemB family protein, partial [Candidatus Peregrinibacteria bacterium]|nr:peptidoglycan bridge formation glycyltransferase FemA/FemB family protein [Candidatus Peregrinibacteria bacterium]